MCIRDSSNVGSLTGTDSLLLILFYALQLYFDFSGYCQMARGLSWIFGLELPVNFRSPYKAVSYTHLDVYKRQIHTHLNFVMWYFGFVQLILYIPIKAVWDGVRKVIKKQAVQA